MRPALLVCLALGLAACGTPPLDAERRPPPPRPRPAPALPERPPPPPPWTDVLDPRPTPRVVEPPVVLPAVPSATITLRSVYPEVALTEWTLENGGHVLFERVEGQPLRLLAVAPGGVAGLDPAVAQAARSAVYARSTDEYGRFELGDASRRIVAHGPLHVLGVFLGNQLGLGSFADGTLSEPRAATTSLPPEAAFATRPIPERLGADRLFLEAVGLPGQYVVAVVGDAEIEEVEAYIAGAFADGGRAPLPFAEASPFTPDSSEVVDVLTGADVSTLVYRGRLRSGDSQAQIGLAAFAAADALREAGLKTASWGRADAVGGTYEVAIAVFGPGAVIDIGERLRSATPPSDLDDLRARHAESMRGNSARAPGRGATQHLVNWHARGGASLDYQSYSRALAAVSRADLSETLRRVFGSGAYRAVLGLDLTP